MRHLLRVVPVVGVLLLAFLLYLHNVPTAPTATDREAAAAILSETGHDALPALRPDDFAGELAMIQAVQDAVLRIAPIDTGIPLGESREPADLYRWRRGLCFDRSRSIEKLLTLRGFKARHVSIFATGSGSALHALLTTKTPSHAVTEVLTSRGWLVVDSNRPWISLTADGRPLSIAALQAAAVDGAAQAWSAQLRVPIDPILASPFTYVSGLYSRHGLFYPPYDPIPDVSWPTLVESL